ncbi:MAG TPA: hypothetical protein VNV60_10695 [Holophagaceae bacterium]|jgi:hypothetical protein|nr:hypothetical protein [Holophagaceae bacterium]
MTSAQQNELIQWLRKDAENQRRMGHPWGLMDQINLLDRAEERRRTTPPYAGAECFLRAWFDAAQRNFKVEQVFSKDDWPRLADELADWLEHETKIRDSRLWKYL